MTETFADFRGNAVTDKRRNQRTSAYYANGQLTRQTDALKIPQNMSTGYLKQADPTYTPFSGKEKYSITENEYDKNGNIVLTRQTVQKQDSSDKNTALRRISIMQWDFWNR